MPVGDVACNYLY